MMQRLLIFVSVLVMSLVASADTQKAGDLVDVTKDSSLSSYFAKINKKVLADGEKGAETKTEEALDSLPATEAARVEESKIPLSQKATVKAADTPTSSLNRAVLSVVGLLLMALAFFVAIQKWGQKMGHKTIANHIKILTQKSIGPKKQLMLIRVAGETILIGVTDQSINHIRTLSLMEDELPDFTEPKFSGQLKEKIEQTKMNEEPEPVDGFAVSRLDEVKNAVSKRYLS